MQLKMASQFSSKIARYNLQAELSPRTAYLCLVHVMNIAMIRLWKHQLPTTAL